MIRLSVLAWLVFLAFLGVGVFHLKYSVQAQEKELRKLRSEISQHLQAMHVLKAEWSYLNDPTRLADLTRRHLDLAPITATQIIDLGKIPMRPVQERSSNAAAEDLHKVLPILTSQPARLPEDRALVHHIMSRISR